MVFSTSKLAPSGSLHQVKMMGLLSLVVSVAAALGLATLGPASDAVAWSRLFGHQGTGAPRFDANGPAEDPRDLRLSSEDENPRLGITGIESSPGDFFALRGLRRLSNGNHTVLHPGDCRKEDCCKCLDGKAGLGFLEIAYYGQEGAHLDTIIESLLIIDNRGQQPILYDSSSSDPINSELVTWANYSTGVPFFRFNFPDITKNKVTETEFHFCINATNYAIEGSDTDCSTHGEYRSNRNGAESTCAVSDKLTREDDDLFCYSWNVHTSCSTQLVGEEFLLDDPLFEIISWGDDSIPQSICTRCGDGVLDVGEECDDGPDGSDTCTTNCTCPPGTISHGGGFCKAQTQTASPVAAPSTSPSAAPSGEPSTSPSAMPSLAPSESPSSSPSASPSESPSPEPSSSPSAFPSATPTQSPSAGPSTSPSDSPSSSPSSSPSAEPSRLPSTSPSASPSGAPSASPSRSPTASPTGGPTASPTVVPSASPSAAPSDEPSDAPSSMPSQSPSAVPSDLPSDSPSASPSARPSLEPSSSPSSEPSSEPSSDPSLLPSASPSARPSVSPSAMPSARPSTLPSASPSLTPSVSPSDFPSAAPSTSPTAMPSTIPSKAPSDVPSISPSTSPSKAPSVSPSTVPSVVPSFAPSAMPSFAPSGKPSATPTDAPSMTPSCAPCPSGEYMLLDCTCTDDPCQACPTTTNTYCVKGVNATFCIDCNCGTCDKRNTSCCRANSNGNNCVANSEGGAETGGVCKTQNGFYSFLDSQGNVCSGVEVSLTAVPNGCGCQPSETEPCTYDETEQTDENRCFICDADDLYYSDINGPDTCDECKKCLNNCDECVSMATTVDDMMACLKSDAMNTDNADTECRENCNSKCTKGV